MFIYTCITESLFQLILATKTDFVSATSATYTQEREKEYRKYEDWIRFLQLYLSLSVCRKQANANKQDVFSLKRLNLSKQFIQMGEKKNSNCLEIR